MAASTFIAVVIIGGTIYAFGYARAVNHRANSDYKKTKAGLPAMRKAYWTTLWTVIKTGFWILIAFALLIAWVMAEARNT